MKIIVVGAGAAGAAATWQLTRNGHDVVCIESGSWVGGGGSGSNFAEWEKSRNTSRNHLPSIRRNSADYPIDDSQSPIQVSNFNGVGGSTILFSGHFPRFLRKDLSINSFDSVGRNWPIAYEELLPFYELNEQMMHVSGSSGDPHYPELNNLRPAIELGQTGELLQSAFQRLGWHCATSYAAINTVESPQLGICGNLGPCNVGCPRGAKATADVIYMLPAIEMGARLITDASVQKVEMKGTKSTGVAFLDSSGSLVTETADIVVLAASAIGTPRVLLSSVSQNYPDGLGNRSGQLGRNLMMHPMGYAEGEFPFELDTNQGPQGAVVFSLEFHRVGEADVSLGYMLQALRGENPVSSAKSSLRQRKLLFGNKLEGSFASRYRKTLGITAVVEDLPEPENRVQIDHTSVDAFGNPGVKVVYRLSSNSKRLLAHGVKSAKSVLAAAGAFRTNGYAPISDSGWHTMGTARMGENPEDSVVDQFGRIHGVDNVFVVDSSIFPTSSCVNPANTIQAMALLLSQKVADVA